MSNIVLDDTQLGRLWTKMLNTFELKGSLIDNATLLWTNSNPTASLSNGNLTLNADISNFKYLIVEWRQSDADAGSQFLYIDNKYYKQSAPTSDYGLARLHFEYLQGFNVRYLERTPNSNTSVHVSDCYNRTNGSTGVGTVSTSTNKSCVPLNIYGANSLKPTLVATFADAIYPVGSYYFSMENVSPASLYGGQWTAVSASLYLSHTEKMPIYTDDTISVSGSHTSMKFRKTDGASIPYSNYRLGIYNSVELCYFNESMSGNVISGIYPYNLMAYFGGHGNRLYAWQRTA